MRLPLDPACFLTIDIRRSRFAQLSVFLMAAAAVFRILYFWGFWKDPAVTAAAAAGQILLPLLSNFLFICFLLFWGRERLWLTILPVGLGCIFFALKALSFTVWHMTLCVLLYFFVGGLYTITVLGMIRTKRPLICIFAIPLAVHIGMDLYEYMQFTGSNFWYGYLPEFSVLCIMGSLLAAAAAMQRRENVRTAAPAAA